MHRSWGGILAGTLFVLPSLVILIALSWIYITYGQVPWIAALFFGIKPAVVAIVLHAAVRIGKRTLHNQALKWIAFGSFLAIFILNLSFPIIVIITAAIGYWGGKRYPEYFQQSSGHGSTKDAHYGAAIIDDHTPTPNHAQFNIQKTLRHSGIALFCWLLPIGILIAYFGWKTLYPQLAWFFTKAAFLTFGGAYAVLPYVYQGAVEHYHWITTAQMIDGLALGETTPGPLIMVITFIGFVSGWVNHALPVAAPWVSGLATAGVATFFTFLPSFVMIFLGAPFIETTRSQLKLAAPLAAITAAVVGVIFNLAVFFALHTFWQEKTQHLNIAGLIIACLAFVALTKFKANTLVVIVASGLVGLALGSVS
jgi:chromate transporter